MMHVKAAGGPLVGPTMQLSSARPGKGKGKNGGKGGKGGAKKPPSGGEGGGDNKPRQTSAGDGA